MTAEEQLPESRGGTHVPPAPCSERRPARRPPLTREARIACWLFLSLLIVYIGTTRGHFISTDEVLVYQATESLWKSGRPTVAMVYSNVAGQHQLHYSQFNSGQSIAALPLYGLGRAVDHLLMAGNGTWKKAFAGPLIEMPQFRVRWGGDVEIFFVNLLNAILTALLCAVFFAFNVRLGVRPRWSLVATALLGLTSYVGYQSTGFFQHPAETLFVLWSFYFLYGDARGPSWKKRLYAGIALAIMLQFRYPSVIALPGLVLYHLLVVWNRRRRDLPVREAIRRIAVETTPFASALFAGFLLHFADQYWKFAAIHETGGYRHLHFSNPLLTGLDGYLLSPGDSIFLFSPLLFLLPWTLPRFRRKFPVEAFFILFEAIWCLVIFSKFQYWAGLWCWGPRFLTDLVPLLFLPLAGWLEEKGKKAWRAVIPLAAVGLWMQVIGIAVNFWYVDRHENNLGFKPHGGFLFIPSISPPAAHSRALLAGNWCVDTWLVNVYRTLGTGYLLMILLPLLLLLGFCVWKLVRCFGHAAEDLAGAPSHFSLGKGRIAVAAAILIAGTFFLRTWDTAEAETFSPTTIGMSSSSVEAAGKSEVELMTEGLTALYARHDYRGAIVIFRRILRRNPSHYGANFQLAYALEQVGRHQEAIPYWQKVAHLAHAFGDYATEATARRYLKNN